MVGQSGLEPPTSRLSVVRSSQLSYGPVVVDAKSTPFVTPSRPSLTALPCVSSPHCAGRSGVPLIFGAPAFAGVTLTGMWS